MAKYIRDFRKGDTIKIKLDYGTSVDLTGFKFWLTLKRSYRDTDENAAMQVVTTAGDYELDEPTRGIVYIVVPYTVTDLIEAGSYYYDIQELSSADEIRTIVPPIADYKDKVVVIAGITEATE